jgi:RNA recognition motif-containing protein
MTKTLYVGNLLAGATSNDIRKLFARYGIVTKAQVVVDTVRHTGRSLGFGFVEMADGSEAAIAALNGAMFQGRALTVNEARRSSEEPPQDRFSDIIDRFEAHHAQPESQEFRDFVHDLQELAEAGHVEAAQELANVLALPGPYYDPESAYKWYYISLSQQGYTVQFEDRNRTPPYYCGPVGDFRNESMVCGLVDTLGFDKVRSLDAEAAHWLAERKQMNG